MATIKSFTSLEQSNELAEILPIESADMWWSRCTITDFGDNILKVSYAVEPCNISQFRNTKEDVPCWSLSALLGVLPILERKGYQKAKPRLLYNVAINKWIVDSHIYTTDAYDNPVDACYEMILKLNELNLL